MIERIANKPLGNASSPYPVLAKGVLVMCSGLCVMRMNNGMEQDNRDKQIN